MKSLLITCAIAYYSLTFLSAQSVPESDFSKGLHWAGVACEDPNYTLWGASPIIGDDGKVHLFIARWSETNVDPAWRKSSEIAHYVADRPEGPFAFSDVALQGTGVDGDWDKNAPHNPEIQRFGDLYVLLYIANSNSSQPPHPNNQFIGMPTSSSPYGPWAKVGTDGMILGPGTDPSHFSYGRLKVNPTLLKVGNSYHLYFKTRTPNTVFGVATSSSVTGPYTLEDNPITSAGVTIEDACSYVQNGKVHFLTTDNHGDVTGISGGGALWTSDDGLAFDPADVTLGFRTIPTYYENYDPNNVTKVYGGAPKFERPKVLMLNGRPRYLYAPSGWNVTGGSRTVVHVLRIDEPPLEESPGNTNPDILPNSGFEAGTNPIDANWGVSATAALLPSWNFGADVSVVLNSGDGTLGFGNGSTNIVSSTGDTQIGFNNNTSGVPPAADVTISQTFATVPGTEYTVAFEMSAISFTTSTMEITSSVYDGTATSGTALGQKVESRTSTGYNPPTSFTFTATSGQSTLVFVETSANTNAANPAIDNVSVRAAAAPFTPEPRISTSNVRSEGTAFSFDWRLSHGSGVDVYRSPDLQNYTLIGEDEWAEIFTDPAPLTPKSFYVLRPADSPAP